MIRRQNYIMVGSLALTVLLASAVTASNSNGDASVFLNAQAQRCGLGEIDTQARGHTTFLVSPKDSVAVEFRPITPPGTQQNAQWTCLAKAAMTRHYKLLAPPVVFFENGAARTSGAFGVVMSNPTPSAAAAAPKNPTR